MTDYSTKREENIIANYDEGQVPALKMLKDSFGGHLPPELDIVNPPNYDITMKGTFSDPAFYASSALGALGGNWGKMGIAYFLFHAPIVAAGIFIASTAARMLGTGGYVRPHAEGHTININDLWAAVRHIDKANGGLADVIAHESSHLLQVHDQRISLSSALGDNRTPLKMLFNSKSGRLAYLSSEYEMQARLFTLITNAYIQHGQVPLNQYELWATLASQGVTPPDGILKMARTNPLVSRAFQRFPVAQDYLDKYADKMAKDDLNNVSEGASDDAARMKLWTNVYPFLYGDLLEIMGDRLGMVRVGHTHNVQLREMFMKAARDNIKGEVNLQDTQKEMQKVACMMRPQDAMSLMDDVVCGKPYKEHSAESIFIPMSPLRAVSAFALAQHPQGNLRKAANLIIDRTGMSPAEWQQRMTRTSQKRGSVPSVKHLFGKKRTKVANQNALSFRSALFPV